LYVFGGIDASNVASTTIQRAPIDERGGIGPFEMYPLALGVARRAHQAAILDNAIAIVGGANPPGDLASTELFGIGAAGQLTGPFAGTTMLVDRRGARAAVVDRTLYVAGGRGNSTPSRTWEAAAVTGTSIGSFAIGSSQIGSSRAFYTTALISGVLIAFG